MRSVLIFSKGGRALRMLLMTMMVMMIMMMIIIMMMLFLSSALGYTLLSETSSDRFEDQWCQSQSIKRAKGATPLLPNSRAM